MFHRFQRCRPARLPAKISVRRRRPASSFGFRPKPRLAAAAHLQEDALTLQTLLHRRQRRARRAGHRYAG